MASRNGRVNRGSAKPVTSASAFAQLQPLTSREMEVVRWIGAAKRNDEIAAILDCSPRTVQKHVQNILHKLGLETRTGACAWWHERDKKKERPRRRRAWK